MKRIFSKRNISSTLPLILLVIVNVTVGLLTFQSYGISWDEPLFYAYADDIGYAYSIKPRIEGTFDIENAYGPSGTDHAIYGPAYLLIGRNIVYLLEKVTAFDRRILWHLVNFLTFQVGVVFVYLLCRRWVSKWGAFTAALLFSTQPLLWGHAYINPKDIPFLVFFLIAVYVGLRFVDRIILADTASETKTNLPHKGTLLSRKAVFIWTILIFLILILLLTLNPLIESALDHALEFLYAENPASLLGKLFHFVAEDAGKVSIEYYAGKLLSIYHWLRIGLIAVLSLMLAAGVFMLVAPSTSSQFWQRIKLAVHKAFVWKDAISLWGILKIAILPGILFGLVTSIRILGILVIALIMLYYLIKPGRRLILPMVICILIATITGYASWPYLWDSPIHNFINVIKIMSNNPQTVFLIFNGIRYASSELPREYLPTMLGITLTEPIWPLFLAGLIISFIQMIRRRVDWHDFIVVILWFMIPFMYVVIQQPPLYDGFRHFLFILPPVFIIVGILFAKLREWVKQPVVIGVLIVLVTLPGIIGIINIFPYEYSYYNSFVGGPSGAFRKYENDYWLTCYREAMQPFEPIAALSPNVYVMRQPNLAGIYAVDGVSIFPYKSTDQLQHGDYILLSTRTNQDQTSQQPADVRWTIGREGAEYCIVKQVR